MTRYISVLVILPTLRDYPVDGYISPYEAISVTLFSSSTLSDAFQPLCIIVLSILKL